MKSNGSIIVKSLLFLFASSICIWILWYANKMVTDMEKDESDKIKQWAKATTLIAQDGIDENEMVDFLLSIVQSNTTIPVVVTDADDKIISVRNLTIADTTLTSPQLREYLEHLKSDGQHIDISIGHGLDQHLYYDRSNIIRRLSYFPIFEIGLVAIFIFFSYMFFRQVKRKEQDKVWIGLARETAHQLGTPITAITGWTELLQSGDIDPEQASIEIQHDTGRLKSIAERFSKIGSKSDLSNTPIADTIISSTTYLQSRIPQSITLTVDVSAVSGLSVMHNPTLIGWALENICRNAVDATEGKGDITVRAHADNGRVVIDVRDTGKGMSRNTAREIFNAGFTTKQRGWGIGLALTKRIICEYHKGKVYVLETEPGKGTTIRIII